MRLRSIDGNEWSERVTSAHKHHRITCDMCGTEHAVDGVSDSEATARFGDMCWSNITAAPLNHPAGKPYPIAGHICPRCAQRIAGTWKR